MPSDPSLPVISILTPLSFSGTSLASFGETASIALAATEAASARLSRSASGVRSKSFSFTATTASPTTPRTGGVPSAPVTTDSISGLALTSSGGPLSMIASVIG